jgi:hypothetical protein
MVHRYHAERDQFLKLTARASFHLASPGLENGAGLPFTNTLRTFDVRARVNLCDIIV